MKRAAIVIATLIATSVVPLAAHAGFTTIASIPMPSVGRIALDVAHDRLWALNPSTSSVTALRASTLEVLAQIVVGESPQSMAVHEPSGRLYVVNGGRSSSVLVIDGLSVVDAISFGSNGGVSPSQIVYSPQSDRMYVTASRGDPFEWRVMVIDPVLNLIETELPGPWNTFGGMTADTRRGRMLIATSDGIHVHDARTGAWITTFPTRAHTMGYDAANDRVLTSSSFDFDGYHTMLDGATGAPGPTINITDHPSTLVADPRTGRVFSPGRVISIIDPVTMTIVGALPGGFYDGIAYDAGTRRLFAASVSQSRLIVFRDDTVAPATALTTAPSGDVAAAFVDVGFEGTDDTGGPVTFECALDAGDFLPCTSPVHAGPLADGPHSFDVRAVDPAGNRDESPAHAAFTVIPETNTPGTTVGTGPSAATRSNQASFTFDGVDDRAVTGFACSLDGAPFAPCTSPHTVTVSDGAHTMRIRAIDTSGNADPTPAEITWVVDRNEPSGEIITRPPAFTNAQTVEIAFTGTDATTAVHFVCSIGPLDREPVYTPCTSPYRLEGLADGRWVFILKAIDAAGNEERFVESADFRLDRVAPVTTLVAAPPDPSVIADAAVSFGATDDVSRGNQEITFRCTFDAAPLSCIESPLRLMALAPGSHRVTVAAIDRAGNVDPAGVVAAWLTAPAAPLVTLPAVIGAGDVQVVVDGPSGATAVVRLDDGDARTPTTRGEAMVTEGRATLHLDASALAERTITATVHLQDAGGNRSPQTVATAPKDFTAPQTRVTTSDGAPLLSTPALSSPVRGIANDATSGVSQTLVVFTPIVGGAGTQRIALLRCDAPALTCAWEAAPPELPGRYAVSVSSTDRAGNTEPTHATIAVLVL